MFTLEFHYRPLTRNGGKEGKVFVRLIYRRKSASITFPWNLYKREWDDKMRCVVHLSEDPDRLAYLREVETNLEREKKYLQNVVNELKRKGDFEVKDVVSLYRFHKQKKGLTFLVQLLSEELKKAGRERTARAYQTTLRMLLLYAGKNDLFFEELTPVFIHNYERYMKEEKKSLNTISFYMRNLRAIYNKGVKQKLILKKEENLFSEVYTGVALTRKRALSEEDLKRLEGLFKEPEGVLTKPEKKALSLFLFSFYTRGMCFVDMANLREKDLEKDRISYYRKKTGKYMEIGLNQKIKKYLKMASSKENSFYLFGILRPDHSSSYRQYCSGLRRQNFHLNRIGEKIGLKLPLTTHMARHSWATIAKKAQIPIPVICEALGHSEVSTTYKYLDSFGLSSLDNANKKVVRLLDSKIK